MTVRFIGMDAFLPRCALCHAPSDQKQGIWDVLLVKGAELQVCPDCKRAHPDPVAVVLERLRRGGSR